MLQELILTAEDEATFFNSVGRLRGSAASGGKASAYKVFSRQPLTGRQLKAMFADIAGEPLVFPWKAYPRFTPPERFSPFDLGNGLYYVNAVETAASAMEMLCVSAKNIAMRIGERLSSAASDSPPHRTASDVHTESPDDVRSATADEL